MAVKNKKRTKSVINAKVQWTLAMRVVLHFFIFVCAGAIFGLINQLLADPFGGLKENLFAFWKHSGPMVLALVCLVPIFIRDTLTLSNRIAGPIHNLRGTCQRLADGEADVPPLKFRDNDMWDDLPALFNKMTDRLRNDETNQGEATQVEAEAGGTEQSLVEV